jgi:ABC-type Fe3+-hydroxamate transport system substrate-binding protein
VREAVLKEHPRIVSLVPSWTETLYSFGFGSEIVGVTKWCVHPKELVAKVERVGGTKDPDVARIVALKPDLVVCDHEEQRKDDVEALRAAGVEVWLSDVRSVDDSLRDIVELGRALGRDEAAHALVARVSEAMAEVAKARREPPLSVFVPVWRRPWMALTRDTYAHHVLALAGARNVYAEAAGRYPETSPEEALRMGATAALLPTEPYPFHEKAQAVEELVAAGFDPSRIAIVDGEALTWYGAREPYGLREVGRVVRELARA